MPVRLSTPGLKQLYGTFESNIQKNPGQKLGRQEVLLLLAQAGSTRALSPDALLKKLSRPGITGEEQVALLKKNLSVKERADLAKVLGNGAVPLAAEAKALLSKVVASWATPLKPVVDDLVPFRLDPGVNLTGGNPVDLPDPDLHADEIGPNGEPRFSKQRFTAGLWGAEGPTLAGIRQGYLGDCYFAAGMASVLHSPGGMEKVATMVKAHGDGTFTVTFKERDRKLKFQNVEVRVDAELYVNPDGSALYGKTGEGQNRATDMKLFFPIIEKAFASWKGSYDAIADDTAANLYEAVLGQSASHTPITMKGERFVWETIKAAVDQGRPITAGTRSDGKELEITDVTGRRLKVYAEHQYSVFGISEVNGQRQVTVRNPWGKIDRTDGGATDGVFTVDLATFKKCFASLSYVDPPRP